MARRSTLLARVGPGGGAGGAEGGRVEVEAPAEGGPAQRPLAPGGAPHLQPDLRGDSISRMSCGQIID